MEIPTVAASSCPRCQSPLLESLVKTAVWRADRLAVIEDIPAHVCSGCMEQYYDEDVSDAMRRLSEKGFPRTEASREMTVPVFSLTDRVVRRGAGLPEDSFVD